MSDEYLFDRSGPPDPAVERLEKLLAPFRHERAAAAAPRLRRRSPQAAAALLAAAGILTALLWTATRPGRATKFELADASGDVRIEAGLAGSARAEPGTGDPLRLGSRVVCGAGATARVRVGDLGSVTLEERTRVRIERSAPTDAEAAGDGAYQLFLERGSVSASIFAAPRVFELGTPGGIAVDLGCVYRTTVDDQGHTTLSVVLGKVSFESEGRKVHVPSRASCRAVPGRGPGTPVWDDASADYHAAVETIDGAKSLGEPTGSTPGKGATGNAADALQLVLTQSRPRDSLTLWNLLDHPDSGVRAKSFDRLAEFIPPPAGLARAAVLAPPRSRGAEDSERFAAWEAKIRDEW